MQPVGGGVHQQMIVTTAKYGLTPHLEIRWGLSVRPWLALNAAYAQAYTAGSPRQQVILGLIYTMRRGSLAPGGERVRSLLGR
jgi:hypothetical protein